VSVHQDSGVDQVMKVWSEISALVFRIFTNVLSSHTSVSRRNRLVKVQMQNGL